MSTTSWETTSRGRLWAFLRELEAANACIDEMRATTAAREPARVPATAMSLYQCWRRAEIAIRALRSPTGGSTERFAREELDASRRAGAAAVVKTLMLLPPTPGDPSTTHVQPVRASGR